MPGKKGVTLIELVVAVTLLAGGSTILIHMLNTGIFANANLEMRTTALNLANERMEEIRDTSFGSIVSGTETGSSIGFSEFDNRIVTVTSTASDLKDVEVEMQWTEKGGQQTLSLRTYVADY